MSKPGKKELNRFGWSKSGTEGNKIRITNSRKEKFEVRFGPAEVTLYDYEFSFSDPDRDIRVVKEGIIVQRKDKKKKKMRILL